jgi:hypothetical protein
MTDAPPDVPVENRQDIIERVLNEARKRGFSKLGQVFREAGRVTHRLAPTRMDELSSDELKLLLNEWGVA